MSGGSCEAVFAMAEFTSWAAASSERLRSNWMVMWVEPKALVELIEPMPAIVENCFSSGVATAEAMVSGLAPGSWALTWMVGKSTLGKSLTGSNWYAKMPKTRIAIMTKVVIMGRLINNAARFITFPCLHG